MTDEKIEAMLMLIHQENKAIMSQLLCMRCYPKDLDETLKKTEKEWDKALDAVMKMKNLDKAQDKAHEEIRQSADLETPAQNRAKYGIYG